MYFQVFTLVTFFTIFNTELAEGFGSSEPLFLTPLIKSGRIKQAQDKSRVRFLTLPDIPSYSGYLTVNETYNSNLFFWFFPASQYPERAPVLLWLNGGPGGSSLFGLFVENGPFVIDKWNQVTFRNTSWTKTHSVLYIDNPVGTGFSFTEHLAGYARTEEQIGRELYNALIQFFTLFPEYQKLDFYATGQSYAGKYIPALAHKIDAENKNSPKIKINLKGMAMGNAFSDPVNMLNYGEFLYNIGLLDEQQRTIFEQVEQKTRDLIKAKKYIEAQQGFATLVDPNLTRDSPSYFQNFTGYDYYYNLLLEHQPEEFKYYKDYLEQDRVRREIHVGNKAYNNLTVVEFFLREDFMQSVTSLLTELLDAEENYKILFYNGNLDIIVPFIATENFLRLLSWHGKDAWQNADKKIWKVKNEIAGYSKVEDNLTYLVVRNAGHVVPFDQPNWALDMINRFTAGKSID